MQVLVQQRSLRKTKGMLQVSLLWLPVEVYCRGFVSRAAHSTQRIQKAADI